MAKVSTLNNLLKDMSCGFSSKDFQQIELLRDKYLRNCSQSGAMIVTSCRHCLSNFSLIAGDPTHKVYLEGEVGCPVCKRPSNLPIPVFPQQIYQKFFKTSDNSEKKCLIKDMAADILNVALQNKSEAANIYWKKKDLSEEDEKSIENELIAVDQLFTKIMVNNTIYNDIKEKATKKSSMSPSVEDALLNSFIEYLLYSNLYGLVNSVSSFASTYHNLHLALKLAILRDLGSDASRTDLVTRFSSYVQETGVALFAAKHGRSTPDGMSAFANVDLEVTYCKALVYTVDVGH